MPLGIFRVRWDPLPPSRDRDISIGAFSHFWAYGEHSQVRAIDANGHKQDSRMPRARGSLGVPVGPTSSYHSLQGDILIFMCALFAWAHRFRAIPSRKWTLNQSKRIETDPNDSVPCSILQRIFSVEVFGVKLDFCGTF